MIASRRGSGSAAVGRQLELALMLLALGAVALNAWLLSQSVSYGEIAGCDGGRCDDLLRSRWSHVLRVPVAALGGLVYVGLMAVVMTRRWVLLSWALAAVLGAALWFVFVQAVLVGQFCGGCLAAHGIGLVVVVLGSWRLTVEGFAAGGVPQTLQRAVGALIGLGLLQIYGPAPLAPRSGDLAGGTGESEAPVHARGTGRKVGFLNDYKTYDVAAMPHLGPPDARRVVVEYFDYSRAPYAKVTGFMATLRARHPSTICVIVLPVPLDRACNRFLGEGEIAHAGSCEIARLALAVWRAKPDAFAELHHWLLQGHPLEEIRARVRGLVPPAALDEALQDPWIEQLLQANIMDWVRYSTGDKSLPKLLVPGKPVLQDLPFSEADFLRLMESSLGL